MYLSRNETLLNKSFISTVICTAGRQVFFADSQAKES